ncbi:unnamed protein product [Moneuplotes crassus]|uniref:Uncharacterized protein n=2 Tax=Euplotes crassus TaxID=5936 RepID=A0AAD2D0B5_EUPCR|nr:unnamed protein product [Moneuplotes crassus]
MCIFSNNLSVILVNIHEIMAFCPKILVLAIKLYRPLYLDFKDLIHKFEIELIKALCSTNNKVMETFQVVDFEKLSKTCYFKVEQLPVMVLKYILLSDNRELQLVALKTLRKICEQRDIKNKYIKPCFKKIPKLFSLFTEYINFDGVNESTIIQDIPEEEIEIHQIYESIDSVFISDQALIELLSNHSDLFEDLIDIKNAKSSFGQIITNKSSNLDNITKVTNIIEMKMQESHLKSFEKRSKTRAKDLEAQHQIQKQTLTYVEQVENKYEEVFRDAMVEFADLLE